MVNFCLKIRSIGLETLLHWGTTVPSYLTYFPLKLEPNRYNTHTHTQNVPRYTLNL